MAGVEHAIRFAGPSDAETIHRLIRELAAYERAPDAVEVSPARLRAQLASPRPPFECLLAEGPRGSVGFALFFQSYSTWKGEPGLYLEDLYVVPEARGHGVGRRLLERLGELARERGYARIEWAVLRWNEPALAFYARLRAEPLEEWVTLRLSGKPLELLGAAGRLTSGDRRDGPA